MIPDAEATWQFERLLAEHQARAADFARSDFEALYDTCESPIERALLPYLMFLKPENTGTRYGGSTDTPIELRLTAQRHAVSGKRRIDFALVVTPAHSPPLYLAIECDGDEFHGNTPEQKAADHRRSEELLSEDGWITLRYTGREIMREPADVARRICKVIDSHIERDIKAVSDLANGLRTIFPSGGDR